MRVCVVCWARVSSVSTPKTRKAAAFPPSLTPSLTSSPWYPSHVCNLHSDLQQQNLWGKATYIVILNIKVDLGECNIKLCHSLGEFFSFSIGEFFSFSLGEFLSFATFSIWAESVRCNFCPIRFGLFKCLPGDKVLKGLSHISFIA